MSPPSQSSSMSFSFSSSLSSNFSSSSNNGSRNQQSHSQHMTSGPSGTTVRTSSSKNGQPAVEETKHYDPHGRELLNAPANAEQGQRRIADQRQRRIPDDIEVEDVTDENDKAYRENIEDEYAKREGGA